MDVSDRHKELLCVYKRAEDLIHSLGIETGEGIDTTSVGVVTALVNLVAVLLRGGP